MSCVVDTDCRYVYSAGDASQAQGQGSFSIFDLNDLDRPVEVDSDPATAGIQPFRSDAVGWGGRKWNFDGAGRGVHTGAGGSYIYDVSDPVNPVEIANTGAAGDSSREAPLAPSSRGFAWSGASEVWDSYWVPVYNSRGVATGKKTNLAYSVDLVLGPDVQAVDVEGDVGGESVGAVRDPTLLPGGSGTDLGPTDAAPLGALGALGALLVVVRRRRILRHD